MTDSGASVTVGLRGAWLGEATDPARSFQGEVTDSVLEALPVGTEVTVRFRDSGRRVTGASEHGSYVLSAAGHEWPVSRFTAHASAAGQSRDDRQLSGEWVAELVNR
ncbi:hypothetical protein [Deinococcus knuensis]|uniref:Uncharacterized protein n=1 Tax=Deinococcus knuensis TaxID=1837380 RepID=A0ABQ2SS06_9DEIO|nr:hypothetical protein [Deinococcus knuensis]GGS34901.1 hypothetical protein GCM10008961_28250 [Deinococcus knuensis]